MWRSAGVFSFPGFFWPVGAALASDEIFRPARRPLFHVLAARIASELIAEKALEIRGRRECRARDAPAASCVIKNKHTSIVTTVTPERPGIPRAMVLRLTSRSPR